MYPLRIKFIDCFLFVVVSLRCNRFCKLFNERKNNVFFLLKIGINVVRICKYKFTYSHIRGETLIQILIDAKEE